MGNTKEPDGWRLLLAPAATLFPTDRKQQRYFLLDAARGIAAFMVLLFHYSHFTVALNVPVPVGTFAAARPDFLSVAPLAQILSPFYRFGWAAVPLFWMISGFVFSSVYLGAAASTREFVINRFARLYPLHFATLIIMALLQFWAVSRFGHSLIYPSNDTYHFILHLFFASDWGFQISAYTFNGPIWSVSVEVLIYAVFWLSRRWMMRFGILLPTTFALACGAILPMLDYGNVAWIVSCCFYFFLGSSLCGIHAAFLRRPVFLAAFVALLLLIAGVALSTRTESMRHHLALPAFFAGAVFTLVVGERFVRRGWQGTLGVIGDNTYGMYLLHVPVQMLLLLSLEHFVDVGELALRPWFLLCYLTVVIVSARVVFVYFERPVREKVRAWGATRQKRDSLAISAP